MSRILYISHDIAQPRGGIGVLYDHVAALREHGLDAFIVHATPGFRYAFARRDVPVIDASHLGVSRTDVLVVPEDHAAAIRKCREVTCRKVLLCQNHFYVFHGLTPGETWRNFGFSAYMCVSSPIQQALRRWFGVDASVVRPAVDDVFFSEDLKPFTPPITVACMPRKGPHNIRLVQGLLAAAGHVHGRDLSWLEIDGLKGVEFRESNPAKSDDSRRLQWLAYRKYAGQVQLVNLLLASRGKDFSRHQDAMYGILYSTKIVH